MSKHRMHVLLAAVVLAMASTMGYAADPFSTNADSGFAGWTLLSGGGDPDVSFYLEDSATNGDGDGNLDGDINSASGDAWGLTAGNAAPLPGSVILLGYNLTGSLLVGQSVSIDMDVGFIDAGDRFVGFELDAAGFDRFQFRFQGGDANFEYGNVSDGYVSTGIPFTDEGLSILFTLTGADSYDLSVTRLSDGQQFDFLSQTLGGPSGSGIDRVEIFNREAGFGLDHNAYFNNLAVVPEPSTMLLVAAGFGALALRRRRE